MNDVVEALHDLETVYFQEFTLLLKDIKAILVFFKIVVIVCLCIAALGFLLWVGNFVLWFYMLSQLFK